MIRPSRTSHTVSKPTGFEREAFTIEMAECLRQLSNPPEEFSGYLTGPSRIAAASDATMEGGNGSEDGPTAVDEDVLAGDICRRVAGQEDDETVELVKAGRAAQRGVRSDPTHLLGILKEAGRRRRKERRTDRVHADAVRSPLAGETARQGHDARFRGAICRKRIAVHAALGSKRRVDRPERRNRRSRNH